MRCFHPLLRHRTTDLLHFGNVVDGIHLLHMFRLDVREAEGVESFAGEFGVVARVGEELRRVFDPLADDVAELAIEQIARKTFPENAAEEILLMQRRAMSADGMLLAL